MTSTHRRWHLLIWLALAPLLAVGLAAGVMLRPRVDAPSQPTARQEARP